MAQVIDEKVVSLKFNNTDFEKNTAESMKTLDKLKSSLSFKQENKELSSLASSVSTMTDSISNSLSNASAHLLSFADGIKIALGQKFVNSAISGIQKLWSSTFGQIKSGGLQRALNIEQAQFQLQGLGIAWEDIVDDINYAVLDTAYGLDEAAKTASQLAASGIQIGDDMATSLRAVSGVAAMTNSSYSEIGQIFATIAGNGRVMGMQLTQLGQRGLNAAATLGEALGVSEEEVRDLVSKGKIDFQTFADAMDYAFGEHAKKANETFTGALSNTKAALSRIGALFETPLLPIKRDILNEITPFLNTIKNILEPFSVDVIARVQKVADAIMNLFKFMSTENASKHIKTIFNIIYDISEVVSNIISPVIYFISNIIKQLLPVFSSGLNILDSISDVITSISEIFGSILYGLVDLLLPITNIIKKALLISLNLVRNVLSLIKDSIKLIADISIPLIKTIIDVLRPLISNILVPIHKLFDYILEIFDKIHAKARAFLDTIRSKITPYIQIISDKTKSILEKVIKPLTVVIQKSLTLILVPVKKLIKILYNIIITIGKCIKKIYNLIKSFISLDLIIKAISTAITIVFTVIGEIINKIGQAIEWVINQVKKLEVSFDTFGLFVSSVILLPINAVELLITTILSIPSKTSSVPSKMGTLFNSMRDVIIDSFKNIKDKWIEVVNFIKNTNIYTVISYNISKIKSENTNIFKIIGSIISSLINGIATILKTSMESIFSLLDVINDVLSNKIIDTIISRLVQLSKGFALIGVGRFTNSLSSFLKGVDLSIRNLFKVETRVHKFQEFATCILILVGTIYLLSKIKNEDYLTGAKRLVEVTALLVVATTIMSKLNEKNVSSSLKFSIALLILVHTIKSISKTVTDDPVKFIAGLAGLIVILGLLVGFIAILSYINNGSALGVISSSDNTFKNVTKMLLTLSISLFITAKIAKYFSKIPFGKLILSMIGFTLLLSIVLGALKVISMIAKDTDTKTIISMNAIFKMISMLSKSIAILAASVFILKFVTPSAIATAFGLLITVLVSVMILTYMAKKVDASSIGSIALLFLAIGASIAIMAYAITQLEGVDPSQIDHVFNLIAIMVLGIGLLAVIGDKSKNVVASMGMLSIAFLSLAASVAIIAYALLMISNNKVSMEPILWIVGALAAIVTLISALSLLTGGSGGMALILIGISVALISMAGAVYITAQALKVMTEALINLEKINGLRLSATLLSLIIPLSLFLTSLAGLSILSVGLFVISKALKNFGQALLLIKEGSIDLEKNLKTVLKALQDFYGKSDDLKKYAKSIKDVFKELNSATKDSKNINKRFEELGDTMSYLSSNISTVSDALYKMVESYSNLLSTMTNMTEDERLKLDESLNEYLLIISDFITNMVKNVGSSENLEEISKVVQAIISPIENMDKLSSALVALNGYDYNQVYTCFKKLHDGLVYLGNKSDQKEITEAISTLEDFSTAFWNFQTASDNFRIMVNQLEGHVERINDVYKTFNADLFRMLQQFSEAGGKIVKAIVDGIDQAITSGSLSGIHTKLISFISELKRTVNTAINQNSFYSCGVNIAEQVVNGLKQGLSSVTVSMNINSSGKVTSNVKKRPSPVTEDILNNLTKGIQNSGSVAKQNISSITGDNNLMDNLSGILNNKGKRPSLKIDLDSDPYNLEKSLYNAMSAAINDTMRDSDNIESTINVPLYIDGREFASATATYMSPEINKINRFASKRMGVN